MSDSSDDDLPLDLRDEEESDEDHPRKRRKTTKVLRGRGVGFVSSTTPADEEEEDDNDRTSFGRFQPAFQVGEFEQEKILQPQRDMGRRSPPAIIRPSAFNAAGMAAKSSFAARQMAKMGYIEGQGLGAKGTGIAAPIQAVGTHGRTGLGMTSAAEVPKKKHVEKTQSQPEKKAAPRAKPKQKYRTIADIEAGGLAVPTSLKSIIIDATGTETRSVSSPAGFQTPTPTASPDLEMSKIASRAKLGLDAYAASWEVEQQGKETLGVEELALEQETEMLEQEIRQQRTLLQSLEEAGALVEQNHFSSPKDELRAVTQCLAKSRTSLTDISNAALAILEPCIRRYIVEWDPGRQPDHLLDNLLEMYPVLEPNNPLSGNTPFQSLLMHAWYPRMGEFINHEWDVYDSEPAMQVITAWKPLLSSWLFCKVIDSLVIPKLTHALRALRKSKTRKSSRDQVPPMTVWIPEWLSLLTQDKFSAASLAELKSHVKDALDSKSWEQWKSVFGKERRTPAMVPVPSKNSTTISPEDQPIISFKELVEEWAIESGLLFQSLRLANARGQPLYRLKPEDGKTSGVVVYLQDDVVFDDKEQPFGLDEQLIRRAIGK